MPKGSLVLCVLFYLICFAIIVSELLEGNVWKKGGDLPPKRSIYQRVNRFFWSNAAKAWVFVVRGKSKLKLGLQNLHSSRFSVASRRKIITATVIFLILALTAQSLMPNQLVKAASNSWTFGDPSGYTVGSGITTASGNATLSTPGSTTGSAVNLNPKTGVYSNSAAQFTAANKDYLTIPSNASLQTGDIDFEIGAWVWLDTVSSGSQTIISKGTNIGSVGSYEYVLYYSGSGNTFNFVVSNGVSERSVSASTFGIPTAGTWNFIRCYHQTSDSKYYIQINSGAADSIADINIFSPAAGTTAFNLGGSSSDTRFLNGRIDSAYFKKSISTSDEATALYNSGAGRTYADLTAGNGLSSFQTALTSWWDLNEESGQRYDAKGTNHLTSAAAQIIAPPVYGSELIVNPGFETAGAGSPDLFGTWAEIAGSGAIADETTAVHGGAHAAKLSYVTGQANINSAAFVSVAGASYSVSFWARGDGIKSGQYGFYDGTNLAYIGNSSISTGVTGTTYTLVSTVVTAPAGCTSLRIYLRSPGSAGDAYFDDVSVKQITTASILNGGFETAGAGGADVFGSWVETVAGTSTINDETTAPYSGSHAVRLDIDASGSIASVSQNLITIGKKYKYTFYAKAGSGTPIIAAISSGVGTQTTFNLTTSYVQYTGYLTADSSMFLIKRTSAASNSIYIDNVTLESIGPLSDAGIAAGTSTDGNKVAQINDISGNNKNFTQTTLSKRPVYSTAGINSKPALQFDGVDDALVKTGDQIGTGDVTVTTVINPRGWGGGILGRIIDNNVVAMYVNSSGSIVLGGGLTATSVSSSIALNSTYIVSATRKSDGKTNIYINGVLSGSADQISTVAAGSDTYIGNRAAGDRGFNGFIGTTQIYNSILSDSQRNQIEKTLGNVYGITVASTAQTAATSIFPNLSTNAPLRYTTLQTFAETLGGGSTGTLRYQLSNDSAADNITSATWYYYTGGAWTAADKNNAWQSNTAAEVNTNLAAFASSVSPGHNLKWRTFFVTDGVDNPILQSVNTTYIADTEAPNNPTLATALGVIGDGSTTLTTGQWHNYANPSFTWNVPTDPSILEFEQSSGLAGYLTYFGTDNTANITLVNNVVTTGADNGAYKWQTGTTFTNAATLASGSTYYLKVIAVDNAGNAHYNADPATYNLFTYKYDGNAPTAPLYVSVTPSGYSRTNNFTFNWPVGGGSEATDTGGSGLVKYQYKVNSEANWYDVAGDATTASVNLMDAASIGLNIFYLQALDNAGNASVSVRTNFYFNDVAPNAPADLTADPVSNTDNAFSFSWTASPGEIAGYYYSVNAAPTLQNANFTTSTSLAEGPYATQQGQNILYVVAKDNAGNYDFSGCSQASLSYNSNTDTCAAVAFTATTTAPGVPGGLQVYDNSDRNNQDYAVTVKWTEPTNPGAGFAGYDVYRSTDGIAYTKIGSTLSVAYADTGLSSQIYFYYVVSKDNADQFSALTTPVSITPTGKFTTPPVLVSGPSITVNPTSIVVKWTTDREASSFVSIKDGNTFVSEQGESTQTISHEVKVVGLRSQSSYTFNIRSTDVDGNSLIGADQEFKTANTPSVYDLVVSNITQTSAIINFKSTAIANFTLYYGETADYGNTVPEDSSSATTNHSLAIDDLKPGTMYYFRVRGDDADGNELRSENSFTTLPMPEISNLTIEPDKEAATTTLKVSWKTNVPTTSILRYAADGVTFKELSTSDMVTEHEITISDLEDQKKYTIYAAGRDQFGNLAESDRVTFDTPKDSRPPKISDFIVESQSNEQGGDTFKVVVSWKTDEPATSKVEFGVGVGDSNLTQSSTETTTLETYHVVVVSGLESSQVYQFRAVSQDGESNLVKSDVQILVTNQPTQTIFELIMQSLEKAFGWLGKLFK